MLKTIIMATVGCIFWLSAFLAIAGECVAEKDALKAWSDAVAKNNRPRMGGIELVQAVCNPCSCPVNGQAACYEYLADKERAEESRRRTEMDLLEQAINHGICR